MARIAFLGSGAMGSRMAVKLIEAGHHVTVWNRTPDKFAPVVDRGAKPAKTARQAVDGADFAFSMVRDDAASSELWLDDAEGVVGALAPETVGIECSTISVGHAGKLAEAFNRGGRTLIEAPLAGSRPQAEVGQLIFFAGGSESALSAAEPVLRAMGSEVFHVGAHGAGATVKLMVNAFLGAQIALMGELISFARKSGVDSATALRAFGATSVCSPAVKATSPAMLADSFPPSFPIDLVAKDFGLLSQSASLCECDVPISQATGAVYRHGLKAGLGADNITGIVQLYR